MKKLYGCPCHIVNLRLHCLIEAGYHQRDVGVVPMSLVVESCDFDFIRKSCALHESVVSFESSEHSKVATQDMVCFLDNIWMLLHQLIVSYPSSYTCL